MAKSCQEASAASVFRRGRRANEKGEYGLNWIDSVSSTLLNKDLDGLWARQQAISDNIANFETPGYKTKNVSFEDQLQAAIGDSGGGTRQQLMDAVGGVQPVTTQASDETLRADGNAVDLEQQNIELARTELNYSYSLQMMSDNFSRLKTAITGGSNG